MSANDKLKSHEYYLVIDVIYMLVPDRKRSDFTREESEHVKSENDEMQGGREIEDDDDEAVKRDEPIGNYGVDVRFSICLSPTYQVPVLWFQFLGSLPLGSHGFDTVYHDLVPRDQKSSIETIIR
ncbi:MAG: hypothetical protein Q9160_008261 [Pyrenula sp. 1 TL-2023]